MIVPKELLSIVLILNFLVPMSTFAKPSNEEVRYYQEILDRITKVDRKDDTRRIRKKINVEQALQDHENLEPFPQREALVKGIFSAMEFLNGHLNGQLEGEVSEFCKCVEEALPEDIASKHFPGVGSRVSCRGLCKAAGFGALIGAGCGMVVGIAVSFSLILSNPSITPYITPLAMGSGTTGLGCVGSIAGLSWEVHKACHAPAGSAKVWMDSTFADPKMQFPYYKEILHYIAILGKRPVGQKQINRLKKIMNNPGLLEQGQGIDEGTELKQVAFKKSKKQQRRIAKRKKAAQDEEFL